MLRKILIILLITLLLILSVVCTGLFALNWYMGTERFKERIAVFIGETYGYTVQFEGKIGVSIYPWLGLETGPMSIELPSRQSQPLVLHASEVSAKVAVVPLFSRRLEFDTVFLRDLNVNLVREEDGTSNVDALVQMLLPDAEATPISNPDVRLESLRVRGIQVHNAHLFFEDRKDGETYEVSQGSFQTGLYAAQELLPFTLFGKFHRRTDGSEGTLDISGNLDADIENRRVRLEGGRLNLILRGEILPLQGGEAHFTSRVEFDSDAGNATLRDLHVKLPELMLAGDLHLENVYDSPRAYGALRSGVFSPRRAVNEFFPGTIPEKDLEIFENGTFSFDFLVDASGLALENLKVFCDKTNLTGRMSVTDFEKPVYDFALVGDKLDFDRYYRIFIVDEPFYLNDFFPDFFLDAQARGTIDLENVVVAGADLSDAHWLAQCGNGTLSLDVDPAGMADGKLKSHFTATISRDKEEGYRLGLGLDLSLSEMQAEHLPLMKGSGYHVAGPGRAEYSFSMPETRFLGTTVVDDVFFGLRGKLEYVLPRAEVVLAAHAPDKSSEKGKERRVQLGKARARAQFKAASTKRAGGGYSFGFDGDFSSKNDENTALLGGTFSGMISTDLNFSDLELQGVALDGQYEGNLLPSHARNAEFAVRGSLQAGKQRLHLGTISVRLLGGELRGSMEGHRIFEKDYTLAGSASFDSKNPLVFLRTLGMNPGKPRGKKAYSSILLSADYAVNPYRAVFHHAVIGMDGAKVEGVVRLEDYATKRITFELQGGAVDVDQYRPQKRKRRDPKECVDPTQLRPIYLPVETLRDLNASGTLALSDLLLYKLHFTNLVCDATAANGSLNVTPLHTDFYGGKVEGGFSAQSAKELIILSLNVRAEDFQAGPFLADIGGKEYVMGNSSLFLDVQSLGATDDDIIANLEGRAGFTVLKGSYKFAGKGGREKIAQGEESILDGRTSFKGAAALFKVDNGGFYNDDFAMDSTFMGLTGNGDFNIDRNTINLELEANYTAGPTVPLRIVGCLDDPAVEVPGGELITNTVKDIIGIPLKPFQYLRDLIF
ncbi:MAG: AsmA family protein [Desulfovibrionaceae bacterium]